MTAPEHSHGETPARPELVLARLDRELSRPERIRYVGLLVVSFAVSSLVATLWATEPSLPLRTHVAFGGLVLLGLSWAAVAGFILTRRRPLYAGDRVLATGMAVAATVVIGGATTALAVVRGSTKALAFAVALGLLTILTALVLHVRARKRCAVLLAERRRLERVLTGTGR